MKKLRILLIIFLVSILYVPRETYALTSEYYSQVFYSEEVMNKIENNVEKVEAIKKYIELNGIRDSFINDNRKVIMFDTETLENNDIYVYLLSNTSFKLYNYYNGNNSYFDLLWGGARGIFNYNNGVVTLSPNDTNTGVNSRVQSSYSGYCNPTIQNCILTLNKWYFDTTYLVNYNMSFENWPYGTQIPYKVDNVVYTQPTTIPLKELLDTFSGITPIGICQNPISKVGELKRVKSLRVSINGISNALKEEMSGKLSFTYTGERLTNNDITISVTARSRNYLRYDSDVTGDYELQCSSTENKCDILYSYIYEDDVDAPLELIFNLDFGSSWSGDINITNCEYTGVFENYSYKYENVDDFNSDIENYLNNSTIGGVDDYLLDFFGSDNFKDKHGISSIIHTPIVFLESLNSKTCAPIQLTIPYINKNATINCMSDVYTSKFNGIYSLIVLAINSVLCYNLALSVVGYVKQAKNPDDDRIEVLDL